MKGEDGGVAARLTLTLLEQRRPLVVDLNLLEKSEAGAMFTVDVNGDRNT
jgi:hypothetical protein